MTTEQKQKALQLLELCIDNHKDGEYSCRFEADLSNFDAISVSIFIGKDSDKIGETYRCYPTHPTSGDTDALLDAAIEGVRTLPERAPGLIATMKSERRARIEREYAELFGN